MPKRKKTRQQKIIADLRHKIAVTQSTDPIQPYTISVPAPTFSPTIKRIEQSMQFANTNPYLLQDMRKTAALTLSLLAAQCILFFFLKHHVVNIPGLSY